MSFREFTTNLQSIRDYKGIRLEEGVIADIIAYLREINAAIGQDKGFSLIMLENGEEVFNQLEGIGGYSGVMIRSPHYIGLTIDKDEPEVEFYGAYYMQAVVKKLYEMNLGSCWINVRNIPQDTKSKLLNYDAGKVNYLLAFGLTDEKALKQKKPQMTVTNEASTYKQDPYGTKVTGAGDSDKARLSISEIVYLHEWGKPATYEELENRGLADILFYVRNAPSYKNIQPCRIILKNGEADLAISDSNNAENYTDAGIMMYTLQGLAKDFGIPCKWNFVREQFDSKEHEIVAKIEF